MPAKKGKFGFTLIELLVVISVIALLLSVLLPSLQKARDKAKGVLCMSNLRQVGQGAILYQQSTKGRFPKNMYWAPPGYTGEKCPAQGIGLIGGGKFITNCGYENFHHWTWMDDVMKAVDGAMGMLICPSHPHAKNANIEYRWSYVLNVFDTAVGGWNDVRGYGAAGRSINSIPKPSNLLFSVHAHSGYFYCYGQEHRAIINEIVRSKNPRTFVHPWFAGSEPTIRYMFPHDGKAPSVFCDGSVRTMSYDDPLWTAINMRSRVSIYSPATQP